MSEAMISASGTESTRGESRDPPLRRGGDDQPAQREERRQIPHAERAEPRSPPERVTPNCLHTPAQQGVRRFKPGQARLVSRGPRLSGMGGRRLESCHKTRR